MTAWGVISVAFGVLAVASGFIAPCFGPIAIGLFAAICGHVGESETRHGAKTGRRLAMFGCVLGWTSPFVSWFLITMFAVATAR